MITPSVLLTSSHADLFDSIPFTHELSPLMNIAAAVINAGYQGVRVFEYQLANGRYLQTLQVLESSHEGKYLTKLAAITKKNGTLPSADDALAHLANLYKTGGARGHK